MHALTATGTLTRFALRRDRLSTTIWTVALAFMAVYPAIALQTIYPTAADRQARAALMTNPAAIVMSGPGYGLDDYTIGAINANEMLLWLMLASAIMNILLITKHTRAEEESGRAELIRAGVVGRYSGMTAALLAAVVANLAVTVLTALGLLVAAFDFGDSLLYAAALGVTGMVFAAISAVAAQLAEHARAGTGIAMAVLGAAVLADGIGNVQETHGNWLSWLSPLAWAQQTRSFRRRPVVAAAHLGGGDRGPRGCRICPVGPARRRRRPSSRTDGTGARVGNARQSARAGASASARTLHCVGGGLDADRFGHGLLGRSGAGHVEQQ